MTADRLEELLDTISDVACCPTHDDAIDELMQHADELVELWRRNQLPKRDSAVVKQTNSMLDVLGALAAPIQEEK